MKDRQRAFGVLERELIYYRDKKRCGECGEEVAWWQAEIHHIDQHNHGGRTVLENGVLVHHDCHPKGAAADAFARKWRERALEQGSVPLDYVRAEVESAEVDGVA